MHKQTYLKMMKHSSLCKKAEPVVPVVPPDIFSRKDKPKSRNVSQADHFQSIINHPYVSFSVAPELPKLPGIAVNTPIPEKKEQPASTPARPDNPPSVEKNHPVQTSELSFTGLSPLAGYLRNQDDINLLVRNPTLYNFSPEQARLYEKLYKPTSDLGNPVKDTLYNLQYGTLQNNPWGLSNRQYEFAKTSPNWKNYERGMTAGYNRGNAFGSVLGYNKGWALAADASNQLIGKQFYKEGDIWTKILNWFLRLFGNKGMYGYVKDAVQPGNK